MGIQFIGASIIAGTVMTLVSFLWPKVTTQPRPEVLTKIHDVVVQTPIGNRIEAVLGEQTINISSAVSSVANSVVTKATTSAKQSVILKMFDSLPDDEKDSFRAEICLPQVE